MVSTIKNNKGFTLLEIIVVMIIVGVLAAIALPNLFANVERQRAQEAMSTIGAIKNAVEACAVSGQLASNCTYTNLGISVPATALFTYTVTGLTGTVTASADTVAYSIVATRNTRDGGSTADSVSMGRAASAVFSKSGVGRFAGVWN